MYAIISNTLYWYQSYRGKKIIVARNGQPVDETFEKGESSYTKTVDINDPEIMDIYNVKFYVEYQDERVKDIDVWQVGDKFPSDRPYEIEKGEACIGLFGAVSDGGWNTNGRDDSHKIISLSDCTKYWAEYTYEKKDGIVCSQAIITKKDFTKEGLIQEIVKHRV